MTNSQANGISKSNKFANIRDLILKWADKNRADQPTLLDIGCRDCILKTFIPDKFKYTGLDLIQNSEGSVNYTGCFPKDFSFPEKSFDVTCALDCLEHMDDIQGGLEAVLRITNKIALVVLPNMAHIMHRLLFCFTGRISGKYDLAPGMGLDRHRWLTTLTQSDRFVKAIASQNGFSCNIIHIKENAGVIGSAGAFLSALSTPLGPEWSAWSSLYQLERIRLPE